MKLFTLFFGLWLVLISSTTFAQANVRGWYADGQVWILWDLDNSPPETHGIYSSAPSFTNINQAQLTGRSSHTVDNSPEASLTADLAIRKPQQFKPPAGRQLQWSGFNCP